jgi:hypothetical protein
MLHAFSKSESYEVWAERVRVYEYGYAMKRIVKGHALENILEEMSTRIAQKMLHPLYIIIKDSVDTKFNINDNKHEYNEIYLKHVLPAADHIDDQLFDNTK